MEIFFQVSNSVDVIEIEELLLRKYHDINYILEMEVESGVFFIKKAFEKESDAMLWDRYLIDYSKMTKENYINFERYKKEAFLSYSKTLYQKEQVEKVDDINKKVERIINLTFVEGGE